MVMTIMHALSLQAPEEKYSVLEEESKCRTASQLNLTYRPLFSVAWTG